MSTPMPSNLVPLLSSSASPSLLVLGNDERNRGRSPNGKGCVDGNQMTQTDPAFMALLGARPRHEVLSL